MIEVEMSKDIRSFQPKLIGPLTKRQLICSAIGLAYGVPAFFLLKSLGVTDVTLRVVICVVLMAPPFLCGWIHLYGMSLEKFMIHVIKIMFFKPRIRKYEVKNAYEEFADMIPDSSPVQNEKVGLFSSVKYSKTDKPMR